jgi:hypothetical protein
MPLLLPVLQSNYQDLAEKVAIREKKTGGKTWYNLDIPVKWWREDKSTYGNV